MNPTQRSRNQLFCLTQRPQRIVNLEFPLRSLRPLHEAMNLPNHSHPERSEGSFATEAESKDPVSFTIDVSSQFHGILRLRAAPPSPARRSAQDDCDFVGSSRPKGRDRVFHPS